MPMQPIAEREIITELTQADLELIKDIYEATRITAPGEERRGIIIFRGPETVHLFENDTEVKTGGWSSLARLGKRAKITAVGPNGRTNGVPIRVYRRVERMFEGSLVWPQGIPVGTWDRMTKRHNGEYRLHNSELDIQPHEKQWLKTISMGLQPLTAKQIARDSDRKNAMRAAASTPEAAITMEAIKRLLGQASVGAQETQKAARVAKVAGK